KDLLAAFVVTDDIEMPALDLVEVAGRVAKHDGELFEREVLAQDCLQDLEHERALDHLVERGGVWQYVDGLAERVAQGHPVVGAVLEVAVHGVVEAANLLGRQGALDAQIPLPIEVPHHILELHSAEETGHCIPFGPATGWCPAILSPDPASTNARATLRHRDQPSPQSSSWQRELDLRNCQGSPGSVHQTRA